MFCDVPTFCNRNEWIVATVKLNNPSSMALIRSIATGESNTLYALLSSLNQSSSNNDDPNQECSSNSIAATAPEL